jgi:hypothetical protein
MKFALPFLAAVALVAGATAAFAAKPSDHITFAAPPPVPIATPNLGALGVPSQRIGAPLGNPGTLGAINPGVTGQNFGALPGNPGSATFDPNLALPSLGNEGTPLAPTVGTSAAGFTSPSTNATSTTP